MRYHQLTSILIALLIPIGAQADRLILKNGNVIETQWVEEGQGRVRYEYYGGEVSIPRERVDRIVTGDDGDGQTFPPAAGAETAATDPSVDHDLDGRLHRQLRPRTPVEEATLATVSIDTGVGFGSGFFISDDGFILTNRHVVRGSETADQAALDKYSAWQQTLDRSRDNLEQQAGRLTRNRAEFNREWQNYLAQAPQARRVRDRQNLEIAKTRLQARDRQLKLQENELIVLRSTQTRNRQEYQASFEQFQKSRRLLQQKNSFEVILADESRLFATLYKVSRTHDLAILKISGYRTPCLEPDRAANLPQGTPLYAIGSPIKLKNSVTSGVFSGTEEGLIQTNAQIYPGNSGGPLVSPAGRVIGINTMKKITHDYEGLGFAIPIEYALHDFRDQLGPPGIRGRTD